jgi:ribosomal protein S18 acetylase RimI-like enzyme
MLEDTPVEFNRGSVLLSTDRRRLDARAVLAMLRRMHWGGSMELATLERAIANSLCVAVYDADATVAFARAVTDLATYAYLTDVVVTEAHRGRGYGSWMVEAFLGHPDLQHIRRIALLTRDARALYERYGFTVGVLSASVYMERRPVGFRNRDASDPAADRDRAPLDGAP